MSINNFSIMMLYNKKILYEELYKALYPKSIVAYATTFGYRELIDGFCNYDLLIAMEASLNSKTWIQISDIDAKPHIIMKINDFYVCYDLGAKYDEAVKGKPSINNLAEDDQNWIKNMMDIIDNTFNDAKVV